jgi:hypothetical protein
MKKIIFCSLMIAFSVAAFAQTKAELAKAKKKEAIANNKFNKKENERKQLRDTLVKNMYAEDSVRLQIDSVADAQKDSMRLVYLDEGNKAIDSNQNNWYKQHYAKTTDWSKIDYYQSQILSQAKFLKGNKLRHAKFINTSYCQKAKQIGDSESNLTAAYSNLNDLRRVELRSLLGKRKERKLEKIRKTYIKKNGAIDDVKWMDANEMIAKN